MPGEAEWEYACRARTTTPFYVGDTITTDLANYVGEHTFRSEPKGVYRHVTTEMGIFPANLFGLCDMHGNVWEWCADAWHDDYVGAPADGSVWESPAGARARLGKSHAGFEAGFAAEDVAADVSFGDSPPCIETPVAPSSSDSGPVLPDRKQESDPPHALTQTPHVLHLVGGAFRLLSFPPSARAATQRCATGGLRASLMFQNRNTLSRDGNIAVLLL